MITEQIAPMGVLLRYLVEHPEYYKYVSADFFPQGEEYDPMREIYDILVAYHCRCLDLGTMRTPTAAEIISEIKTRGKDDIISDDYVKTLYDINLYDYSEDDLRDKVEQWIRYRTYRTNYESVAIEMRSAEREQLINVETASEYVDRWTHMIDKAQGISFDNGEMLDIFDAEMHKPVIVERTPSAYTYLNDCLGGGFDPKTLVMYLGGTNVGKCACAETVIRIRNRRTGEVREISLGDFYGLCAVRRNSDK